MSERLRVGVVTLKQGKVPMKRSCESRIILISNPLLISFSGVISQRTFSGRPAVGVTNGRDSTSTSLPMDLISFTLSASALVPVTIADHEGYVNQHGLSRKV